MKLLAVDPSPTCTGSVICDGDQIVYWSYTTHAKKWTTGKYETHSLQVDKVKRADEVGRLERIARLRGHFKALVKKWRPDYIAIEDYVWASQGKGGGIIQMAEVGSQLRMTMRRLLAPCRTYDPMTVKLFWTGKMTADKPAMMAVSATMVLQAPERFADASLLLDLYQGPQANKASQGLFEAVSDALAISELLAVEVAVKTGRCSVKDLPDRQYRALTRETKDKGCILDTEFF